MLSKTLRVRLFKQKSINEYTRRVPTRKLICVFVSETHSQKIVLKIILCCAMIYELKICYFLLLIMNTSVYNINGTQSVISD